MFYGFITVSLLHVVCSNIPWSSIVDFCLTVGPAWFGWMVLAVMQYVYSFNGVSCSSVSRKDLLFPGVCALHRDPSLSETWMVKFTTQWCPFVGLMFHLRRTVESETGTTVRFSSVTSEDQISIKFVRNMRYVTFTHNYRQWLNDNDQAYKCTFINIYSMYKWLNPKGPCSPTARAFIIIKSVPTMLHLSYMHVP